MSFYFSLQNVWVSTGLIVPTLICLQADVEFGDPANQNPFILAVFQYRIINSSRIYYNFDQVRRN